MKIAVAYEAADTGQSLYTVTEVRSRKEAEKIRFVHGHEAYAVYEVDGKYPAYPRRAIWEKVSGSA